MVWNILQMMRKQAPQDLAEHAPAVAKCLQDPSVVVRRAACEALQKLSPQDLALYAPALAKLLYDPADSVRYEVMLPARLCESSLHKIWPSMVLL